MLIPPDDGRGRPLLVRYMLGNVRTRSSALRLVIALVVFSVISVLIRDPLLVVLAVVFSVLYVAAILWMDRHDAWAPADAPDDSMGDDLDASTPDDAATDAEAEADARAEAVGSAEAAHRADAVPAAGAGTPESARPRAIESLRTASFDAVPTAAAPSPRRDLPSRVLPMVIVVILAGFVGSLVALETGGSQPTGSHLVEVSLDALFGIGFSLFALVVALERRRLPSPLALSVAASVGLGFVAGLGYNLAAVGLAMEEPTGPGVVVGWFIGAASAGAGLWLTASTRSRNSLAFAIPAVLIGWFVGYAFWIAHVNAV